MTLRIADIEALVSQFESMGQPQPSDIKQVGGNHYARKTIQPWDAAQAWMTPEQFEGYLLGTAIAYLGRYNDTDVVGKGGITDVKKAIHVLEKLTEVIDYAPIGCEPQFISPP